MPRLAQSNEGLHAAGIIAFVPSLYEVVEITFLRPREKFSPFCSTVAKKGPIRSLGVPYEDCLSAYSYFDAVTTVAAESRAPGEVC